jgi:hypothetical protein
MKRLLLLALASFTLAQADIIPMIVGTGGTNCAAGSAGWTCDYNYTATVHDEAMLTARRDDHREFFTIYDFNGFEGTVMSPTGWMWVPGGLDPSLIDTSTIDNPFIPNITWEFTGGPNVPGGTVISGFMARSFNGPSIVQGYFSSQASHATVSPGPTWVQNVGHVDVPNPLATPGETAIPEPMSMALIGSGFMAIGLLRKFRK